MTLGQELWSCSRSALLQIVFSERISSQSMLFEPDETFTVTFEPVDASQGDSTNFVICSISETTITILDQDSKLILLYVVKRGCTKYEDEVYYNLNVTRHYIKVYNIIHLVSLYLTFLSQWCQ